MTENRKLLYIDYFRAFTILTIVICHTTIAGSGNFLEFERFLFMGNTAFFIFIAGFLFEYLLYKFNYLTYLKKKLLNVFMPYLFTITPVAILAALYFNEPEYTFYYLPFRQKIFGGILFGQTLNPPMWFIGMITLFYVLSPIFALISKKPKIFYGITFCCIIYTITNPRPWYDAGYMAYKHRHLDLLSMYFLIFFAKSFLYFAAYWLLGMLICKKMQEHPLFWKEKMQKNSYLITAGLCFTGFLCAVGNINALQNLGLIKFLSLIFFFAFFVTCEKYISTHRKLHKCAIFLADYSFGIFFLHHYLINMFQYQTPYMQYGKEVLFSISETNLQNLAIGWTMCILVLIANIVILFCLKKILTKLGIKHTRPFIGIN